MANPRRVLSGGEGDESWKSFASSLLPGSGFVGNGHCGRYVIAGTKRRALNTRTIAAETRTHTLTASRVVYGNMLCAPFSLSLCFSFLSRDSATFPFCSAAPLQLSLLCPTCGRRPRALPPPPPFVILYTAYKNIYTARQWPHYHSRNQARHHKYGVEEQLNGSQSSVL